MTFCGCASSRWLRPAPRRRRSALARLVRILAPNPGPFTLDGTNTWIVGERPAIVIDPGPDDESHLAEVARSAGAVEAIVITHHHPDHAPGAARLAAAVDAPVLAWSPVGGERSLRDVARVVAGGVTLDVVHTPGHTPDHVALFDPVARALFTGDAVLGRGTSVIDPPEGDVGAYVASLEEMRALGPRTIYPGHGPAVWDADAKLHEYLEHRAMREGEVKEGLADGARTPEELVPGIYRGYPPELHPVAARSVLAHLLKLERDGVVVRVAEGAVTRFALSNVQAPDPSS